MSTSFSRRYWPPPPAQPAPRRASAARRRIIDAALALAIEGGMDAMQMRDVATRANVSTRTLHVHFPSKNYLLLAALVERGEDLDRLLGQAPRLRDPVRRVVAALEGPTNALVMVPHLARALVAAMVAPDERAIPLLREYRDVMLARVVQAITTGEPTSEDVEIALALQAMWFSALVSWTTGIEQPEAILEAVGVTARHLLAGRTRPPASPRGAGRQPARSTRGR